MPRPIITLLTDFGTRDYYVGALRGTLLRLAPESLPIDISHDVDSGDVEQGAYLLGASHRTFPSGTIHLAVIDPGVGGDRRILAARSKWGLFVAPDNGLLTPVLDEADVVHVQATDLFLEGPGATFHGRDRFAPVAAYLARGEPFEDLGDRVGDPFRLATRPPRQEDGVLEGRIVHIDRFGNLITDIPSCWLFDAPVTILECMVSGLSIDRRATHYAELEDGRPAFLPGSQGTLEIALKGEQAAAQGRIRRGQTLRITFR